jgi:hypothetical protein
MTSHMSVSAPSETVYSTNIRSFVLAEESVDFLLDASQWDE